MCLVSVGGSGVGGHLLRRVIAAHAALAAAIPGLRLVVVAGPRIDPATLGAPVGVEVHGSVPNLYQHLAACDIAIVQGGLTTTMELAAAGRPFLYVPLRNHFEQNLHVRHRLDNYGAGRCLSYDELTPGSARRCRRRRTRPCAGLPPGGDHRRGPRRGPDRRTPVIASPSQFRRRFRRRFRRHRRLLRHRRLRRLRRLKRRRRCC